MVREPHRDGAPCILIVVGAHPQAERHDRPLAYSLKEKICKQLDSAGCSEPEVMVCSDLWYLNHEDLFRCPVVAIGNPSVNAASAYLTRRLPPTLTIDGSLQIQFDGSLGYPRASAWGMSHAETNRAVDRLWEKHGEEFIAGIAGLLADLSNL